MEKQAWRLFPTPMHYFKDVLSPDQLQTVLAHCLAAEAKAGKHLAFGGDAVSTHGEEARLIDELDATYANLRGIKTGLSRLIQEFARELGYDNVKMTNSWFNIQRPGSVLKHHVHPKSIVSVALCIQSDEASSKLFFENPNPVLNLLRPDRYTESTFEFMKFHLNPGDMAIFPSWIKHGSGYEPNMSEQRVVISINAH